MKKYTKEEILNLMNESQNNIDELADYKKKLGQEKKWEPIMSKPQTEKGYEGSYKARGGTFRAGKSTGEHIGHKVIDKTTNEPLVIFYPCDKNVDDFLVEYKDAIEALKEEYGDFYISKDNTIPSCEPRTQSSSKQLYKPSGEEVKKDVRVRFEKEMKDAGYIKRYLIYPLVREILGNEVNQHLVRCGIPIIKVNERAFLDRYSNVTNDSIKYATMNFNWYDSPQAFFDSAVRRVKGKYSNLENEHREGHMARQFNTIYRNWDKNKKLDPKNYGLTSIYNLEKYGYSLTNLEISVSSLFKITGRIIREGDTAEYIWDVSFKTDHSKLLKDDKTIKKELTEDFNFERSESVEIENIEFTEKDSIVKNEDIVNALKTALLAIKEDILSIPIVTQLKNAKLSSFQLTPEQKEQLRKDREERMKDETTPEAQTEPETEPGQMNESFVDRVVKSVISELQK